MMHHMLYNQCIWNFNFSSDQQIVQITATGQVKGIFFNADTFWKKLKSLNN